MADAEPKEFDTNVADADERKRIRAQRIEARRDAEKGALDKANEERKAAERSQGKQQIAESLSHLDKKFLVPLAQSLMEHQLKRHMKYHYHYRNGEVLFWPKQ